MNFKEIIELIAEDMSDVNIMMNKKLISEEILINELINYILSSEGKRIRPIIVFLVARVINYNRQHVVVAALIEFIHISTLLHDDVIDCSNMRRGRLTTNVEFSNSVSVLVGDFIYTKAFQMMISLNSSRILSLVSEAVNIIAEGELFQLMNCSNLNISIESYMKIIYKKTAKLFEVASQSSAILAGAHVTQEIALRNYGCYLGIAFQLIDDMLDYVSDSGRLGKNVGDDLSEGKLTLPLLHAMQHSTAVEHAFISQALKKGNNTQNFLEIVLEMMYQYGSLEYTRECAKRELDKAVDCLRVFSPSPYLKALENLVSMVLNRDT